MAKVLKWRSVAPGGEAFHVARVAKTRRNPVPLHGHDFSEIFWLNQGTACHTWNGLVTKLEAGHAAWLQPGDFHSIDSIGGEPFVITNIAFPAETFLMVMDRYPNHAEPLTQNHRVVSLTAAQLNRFDRAADELGEFPKERLFIERFLLNALAAICAEEKASLPESTPEWLRTACREMRKPENLCLGVERFFRLAGRSHEHVARTMKLLFRSTPTEWVNRSRLEYASQRLELSADSILEVALASGFENLSHFYRLFKQQFGMTPRAFRARHGRLT